MGQYVNPGAANFSKIVASPYYVDKTELISLINKKLGSSDICFCNSRPRRFGKSTTVNMLAAYYGQGEDSQGLFHPYKIAQSSAYLQHLNKYTVICFDVQWAKLEAGGAKNVVAYLEKAIIAELTTEYPSVEIPCDSSLPQALATIHHKTGATFAILIDEWDVIIREDRGDEEAQLQYLNFLRNLFKGLEPAKYLAFAYMTGILPIKKYNTQSALNNFEEYTMLDPAAFAPYIGFTDDEVQQLCKAHERNYEEAKLWYDGYLLDEYHIYNPKAVTSYLERGKAKSYWSQTGTYETIKQLININFDGLKESITKMLAGESIPVVVNLFANDMNNYQNIHQVLTALIHLGYLAYDGDREVAYIPNEEIRSEFLHATAYDSSWQELNMLLAKSEALLKAVLQGSEKQVGLLLNSFHEDFTSILQYNNENALSSLLNIAMLSSLKYYYKPIREMPAGKGYADLVFLPKKEQQMPALIIELKWQKSATAAIEQIKERHYAQGLEGYKGQVLLVGINYDKASKEHHCKIEELIL